MYIITKGKFQQKRIEKIRMSPIWNMYTAAKNRLASSLVNKPNVLNSLARRANESVQLRVAENRTTSPETLKLLSKHESSNVRSGVAQNENSPRSTAELLAVDANCDVRFAMAENPRTSTSILKQLSRDENPYVQDRAKRTIARLKAEETYLIDRAAL